MSNPDATPDPATEPIAFGQRMKILRTRKGMTREVLAGLLGKSTEWVKALENGRMQIPRFDTVLAIAEALRIRDLADLTGRHVNDSGLFIGPGHPRLAAVAAAVNAMPGLSPRPAPPTAHVRARLDAAWTARHQAENHREKIGQLLPDLIRDAQLAVRHADTSAERRAAQSVLSETYSLTQFFVAYQPDSALLWRVAERGMVAAQESEDPRAIGVSAWLLAQAHRDSGVDHFDAADSITMDVLAYLEPQLQEADDRVVAIAGALQFEAGYTAARRGDNPGAWAFWTLAGKTAEKLPADYYDPITSFSRAIMGAHATTVAVELHAGGESVRQAARSEATVIPSRPRRARHRIEQARAYQLDGQPDTALAVLDQAFEAAPETIRYNGYAKRIILEGVEAAAPDRRRRAAVLAEKVGLLAG